ncbi:MAG: hypothetical protein ACTSUC_04680, partial [Promethearchaeota archaeon]
MIENCEDILECENKLSSITKKVNLLGEYPLSIEEVDKLGVFIKEQISDNIRQGTKFLNTKAPTCLACFLVWKGILEYKDGDYWSQIEEGTGLQKPNWQAKWGKIFVDFLESNKLLSVDIKDAHRYVTPILVHGMIPNSCLNEYFEKVLLKLVKHELADPTDKEEIRFLLENRREDNKERNSIEDMITKLQTKKNEFSTELSKTKSLIKIWDKLEKIRILEDEVWEIDELDALPENLSEYRCDKKFEIETLQRKIENLKKKKKQYEQEIKDFLEGNKKILAYSDSIIECINILPELRKNVRRVTDLKSREGFLKKQLNKHAESIFLERWDERYGEIIINIPFDNLKKKIEKLYSRKAKEYSAIKQSHMIRIGRVIHRWIKYIYSLFTKKRYKTDQELYKEIREMLGGLPIDESKIEELRKGFIQNLTSLKNIHENLCQLRDKRETQDKENLDRIGKIKNVAQSLGFNVTDSIEQMVTLMQKKLNDSQKQKKSISLSEQEINKIKINLKT